MSRNHRRYSVASIEATDSALTPWQVTILGGMRPVTYRSAGTREQVEEKAQRVVDRINSRPEWAITLGGSSDRR